MSHPVEIQISCENIVTKYNFNCTIFLKTDFRGEEENLIYIDKMMEGGKTTKKV